MFQVQSFNDLIKTNKSSSSAQKESEKKLPWIKKFEILNNSIKIDIANLQRKHHHESTIEKSSKEVRSAAQQVDGLPVMKPQKIVNSTLTDPHNNVSKSKVNCSCGVENIYLMLKKILEGQNGIKKNQEKIISNQADLKKMFEKNVNSNINIKAGTVVFQKSFGLTKNLMNLKKSRTLQTIIWNIMMKTKFTDIEVPQRPVRETPEGNKEVSFFTKLICASIYRFNVQILKWIYQNWYNLLSP